MKRWSAGFAILFSVYATRSFATLPTGAFKDVVCAPSYCCGFTLGLSVIYWRPSSENINYAITYPSLDATGTPVLTNGEYHTIDHDYDWGLKATIGYVFPCTGNDLNLTGTIWDGSDYDRTDIFTAAFPATSAIFFESRNFTIAFPQTPITFITTPGFTEIFDNIALAIPALLPTFEFLVTPEDVTAISAHSGFQNQTWDVEYGQAIKIGCNLQLRLFEGLRSSRLAHALDVTTEISAAGTVSGAPVDAIASVIPGNVITSVPVTITPVFGVTATLNDIARQKTTFNGFGPRLGLDSSYYLGHCFGIVSSLSTSLLLGHTVSKFSERIETHAEAVIDTAATVITAPEQPISIIDADDPIILPVAPVETISFDYPKGNRVVPNFDAKIGLNWTYALCYCPYYKVNVETGYMISRYFSPMDRLSGIGSFAPEVRTRQKLDVSFDGYYISAEINF